MQATCAWGRMLVTETVYARKSHENNVCISVFVLVTEICAFRVTYASQHTHTHTHENTHTHTHTRICGVLDSACLCMKHSFKQFFFEVEFFFWKDESRMFLTPTYESECTHTHTHTHIRTHTHAYNYTHTHTQTCL